MVDDCINSRVRTSAGKAAAEHWYGRRGPKRRLSLSEALTLTILRLYYHLFALKALHRLAANADKPYFPGLPTYEHLLKAANQSFPVAILVLNDRLSLNRQTGGDGLFVLDPPH